VDETLRADLRLSHGFLNLVSAGYEGIYVYLNARHKLAPDTVGTDGLEQLAPALDRIHGWWDDFEAHRPLVTLDAIEDPPEPFLLAWNWLEVTKNHMRSLVSGLAASSHPVQLAGDVAAVHLRAAAACEVAYGREHFVRGLIRYGEVMDEELVADRWRQHLLPCQADVAASHRQLALAERMGGEPDAAAAAQLLDETLALPAILAQRVMDINGMFAEVGRGLTYETADIPEASAGEWSSLGFPPEEAGRWYGVGYQPDEARRWLAGGVPDPTRAFDFMLRGFTAEEAGAWLRAGVEARAAAARRQQGLGPGDEPPAASS
jgi:hypothetical protein